MTEQKQKSGWLNIAVDYGPLLVFLGVYKLYQPGADSTFGEIAAVIYGTIAFMVAAVVALAFSKWKFGKVSPMLLLSTGLIVGFGALTVWLRDEVFIQIKPSVIYAFFGVVLLIGYARGKALLHVEQHRLLCRRIHGHFQPSKTLEGVQVAQEAFGKVVGKAEEAVDAAQGAGAAAVDKVQAAAEQALGKS